MANETRFLLGKGERLTSPVAFRSGFGEGDVPYAWENHRNIISSQLVAQAEYFETLSKGARPNDMVVSIFKLHPQFYSRSAFPAGLLNANSLRFIGSKPAMVKPRSGRGADKPRGVPSTDIFIVGKRRAFRDLQQKLASLGENDPQATDLLKIEQIAPLLPSERVQEKLSTQKSTLEVVLHFDPEADFDWEEKFRSYADSCEVRLKPNLEFQSRGLWFVTAEATASEARQLAEFSFVRAIRPMPKIRIIQPLSAVRSITTNSAVRLPTDAALDPDMRVAVFDGGLPDQHLFGPWVRYIEPSNFDNIGAPISVLQEHGLAVTSAMLFGNVKPGNLAKPYSRVDHYRVLGDKITDSDLYTVLLYVDKILSSTQIDLANFSFGPEEIVGNDQVTAWTTMLDDHFHDRGMLATIAVGNNGEKDEPNNRILVPSDCINAIAVGACDHTDAGWKRAPYSCVGPGRTPGLVKPDLVAFGGTDQDPFTFIFPDGLRGDSGTSYAAPYLLRTAAGLRAHFGRDLSNLALRALLLHSADGAGHPRVEVGWGQCPPDPADIAICGENSVRIVYQGTLDPSKVIRAEIPLPDGPLDGKLTIRATMCYLCRTDASSPGDYTRAGLDITFRPHVENLPKPTEKKPHPDPNYPLPSGFFKGVGTKNEQDLRSDALKWDTVRHAERSFNASSLLRPVFDIHYVARSPGASMPRRPEKIGYALVVTVTAKRHPDLYERVKDKYRQRLEALQPRTELPIRVDVSKRGAAR